MAVSSTCRLYFLLFPESREFVVKNVEFTDCVAYCCTEDYDGDLDENLFLSKGVNTAWTGLCNKSLDNKLRCRQKSLPPPVLVAMASDGRYYIQFADGKAQWDGPVGDDFGDIVRSVSVRSVSFGACGTAAIVGDNGAVYPSGRLNSGVVSALKKANGRKVQCVSLNPEHAQSYVVGFEDGGMIGFGNKELTELHKKLNLASDEYVKSAHMGARRSYLIQVGKRAATTEIPAPDIVVPTAGPILDVTDTHSVGVDIGHGRYYFGPVRNGKERHGRGVCVYDSTASFGVRWISGTFVGGHSTSKCSILETTSGDVYRGGLLNGEYNGNGSLLGSENSKFSHCGGFTHSLAFGQGVREYADGRYTIGYFGDGKREGQALTVYGEGDSEGRLLYRGCYESDTFEDTKASSAGMVYVKTRQPPLTPTLSEMDFCTRIVARAQQLLHGSDLFSITRTADISANNKALCSFIRGLRVLRDDLLVTDEALPLDGVFAWHGTSTTAIDCIMNTNFDTRFRKLQNQGPGEYLAYNYQDALAFAKDASLLVLTYTPRGPHLATTEDFCVVVKNPPSHSNIAFAFPVLVVKVSDSAPRFNQPKWGLRWQYCFEGDGDQQWIPYTPQVNAILCEASSRRLAKDPNASNTCVIRCLKMSDGRTETYEINLDKYTQRNLRTNYIRAIHFVKVPAVPLGDAPAPPLL